MQQIGTMTYGTYNANLLSFGSHLSNLCNIFIMNLCNFHARCHSCFVASLVGLIFTEMAASAGVNIVEFSYLLPRIIGDVLLLSKRRFSIDLFLLLIRGLPSIVTSSFEVVDCNVKVNGSIDLNPLSVDDDDDTTADDTRATEGEKAFVVINDEVNAASNIILDDTIANTDIHISS